MGTRGSISEEIPASLCKDRINVNHNVLSLEDKAHLTGEDYNTPCFWVIDVVNKFTIGLSDMIHGSVVASKPKTMQEAIEIATELMDKKVLTFVEREIASKRKFENTSRTTRNQQQEQQHSNKRQNTGRVYTAAPGGKKQYGGPKPLCAK
nr:hypothetical protein [Tanacetum cinerariifolium]